MEKKYVIFLVSEINKINFSEVLETSEETLRISIDKSKTFVSWIGFTPQSIKLLESKSEIYNHTTMIEILNTSFWNSRIK